MVDEEEYVPYEEGTDPGFEEIMDDLDELESSLVEGDNS